MHYPTSQQPSIYNSEQSRDESIRQFSTFFFPSLREGKISISRFLVSSRMINCSSPLPFYFSRCFFFFRSASLRASWNMKRGIFRYFKLSVLTIKKTVSYGLSSLICPSYTSHWYCRNQTFADKITKLFKRMLQLTASIIYAEVDIYRGFDVLQISRTARWKINLNCL